MANLDKDFQTVTSNIEGCLMNLENIALDEVKTLQRKIRQEEYEIKCYEETVKSHDLQSAEMEKVIASMEEKTKQLNDTCNQMQISCNSLRAANSVLEDRIRQEEKVVMQLKEKRLQQRERLDKEISKYETILIKYQEMYDTLPRKHKLNKTLQELYASFTQNVDKANEDSITVQMDGRETNGETVQSIIIKIAQVRRETLMIIDKINEKLEKKTTSEDQVENVENVPELMEVVCNEAPENANPKADNLLQHLSQTFDAPEAETAISPDCQESGEYDGDENTPVIVSSNSEATQSAVAMENVMLIDSPGFPFATRPMFAQPDQQSADLVPSEAISKNDTRKVGFLLWASQDQAQANTSSAESAGSFHVVNQGESQMDSSQFATVAGAAFNFGTVFESSPILDQSEPRQEFNNLFGTDFASPEKSAQFSLNLF